MIPEWRDYLPRAGEERAIGERAEADAKRAAARIASLPIDGAAAALLAAAAEVARMAVLDSAHDVMHAYRASYLRVLREPAGVESREAIAGLLAYHNAVECTAGRDDDRRLDERALLARARGSSMPEIDRVLGYAALALGAPPERPDPTLAGLVAACACADEAPFHAFVRTFFDGDLGYAELMLAARAYVERVAERGLGVRPAAWLRGLVRGGIPAIAPRVARPIQPPPPAQIACDPEALAHARTLLGDGGAVVPCAWSQLVVDSVHGLWGGEAIAIDGRSGEVAVVVVARGQQATRFRAQLAPHALAMLDTLLRSVDAASLPSSTHAGVPDQASTRITFDHASATRWDRDPEPRFDAIARWVRAVAAAVADTHAPVERGVWDRRFP